jgi:hypothetical protein
VVSSKIGAEAIGALAMRQAMIGRERRVGAAVGVAKGLSIDEVPARALAADNPGRGRIPAGRPSPPPREAARSAGVIHCGSGAPKMAGQHVAPSDVVHGCFAPLSTSQSSDRENFAQILTVFSAIDETVFVLADRLKIVTGFLTVAFCADPHRRTEVIRDAAFQGQQFLSLEPANRQHRPNGRGVAV